MYGQKFLSNKVCCIDQHIIPGIMYGQKFLQIRYVA